MGVKESQGDGEGERDWRWGLYYFTFFLPSKGMSIDPPHSVILDNIEKKGDLLGPSQSLFRLHPSLYSFFC